MSFWSNQWIVAEMIISQQHISFKGICHKGKRMSWHQGISDACSLTIWTCTQLSLWLFYKECIYAIWSQSFAWFEWEFIEMNGPTNQQTGNIIKSLKSCTYCMRYLNCTTKYVDFSARNMNLRLGLVITPGGLLKDVITCACHRCLLLEVWLWLILWKNSAESQLQRSPHNTSERLLSIHIIRNIHHEL